MSKLPSIPSVRGLPTEFTKVLGPMKTILETLLGVNGDALRAVTYGTLYDDSTSVGLPSGSSISASDPMLDATPIPAPTSFTVLGALNNIIMSWDPVTLNRYSHTEIWRRDTTNDISGAAVIGTTRASVYVDDNVAAGVKYYYWVRHVSYAGVLGAYNAGGTAGTEASLGLDPELVMNVLTQQPWQASTYYRVFSAASPSTAKYDGDGKKLAYVSTTTGTSSSSEPTWPTTIGGTVVDGTVTWEAVEVGKVPFVIGNVDGQDVVCIDEAVINDASIGTAKIALLAVDTANIALAAVGQAQIDLVSANKLVVDTANIEDAAITTAKIGAAQVDTANIADAAITSAQIEDAAVGTLQIAGSAVTASSSSSVGSTTIVLTGDTGDGSGANTWATWTDITSFTLDVGTGSGVVGRVFLSTGPISLLVDDITGNWSVQTFTISTRLRFGSTYSSTYSFSPRVDDPIWNYTSGTYNYEGDGAAGRDVDLELSPISWSTTNAYTGGQTCALQIYMSYASINSGPAQFQIKAKAGNTLFGIGTKR